MANLLTAIGLMSGTSIDAIDVALIRTDGENTIEHGPAAAFEFDATTRQKLADAMQTATVIHQRDERPDNLAEMEREITDAHVTAVDSFLQKNRLTDSDIDIIGFHGQTVLHRPNEQLTVQLGDGQRLANKLSIRVVYDLRAADVAAGGEGAPLVPVYHRALCSPLPHRPVAFVNIGGISNVTFIDHNNNLLAFDCGPGNALLNDWVQQHTNGIFDENGALAKTGTVNEAALQQYLLSPYFGRPVPKSLDRGDFTLTEAQGLSPADGARTLTELTAKSIANAARWFNQQPHEWIVCGGGRRNKFLMQRIAASVQGIVTPAEAHRLDGDMLEAQAFAYLAVRSLKGLPITFPATTGVETPMTGGKLVRPRQT